MTPFSDLTLVAEVHLADGRCVDGSLPSSALKWETVEKIAKDPSLVKVAFDQEKVDTIVRR